MRNQHIVDGMNTLGQTLTIGPERAFSGEFGAPPNPFQGVLRLEYMKD